MEITNASLNEFDQDKCLDDGVACAADFNALHFTFVESTESIAEILLDLTLGSHSDLVIFSCFLFFYNLCVSLHLWYVYLVEYVKVVWCYF